MKEDSELEAIDNYSKYGVYSISDDKEFSFPGIQIKISKISDKVFSYQRIDSEQNMIEKNIPSESGKLTLELCPIRPLNYPARRTTYVYLEFETPIFLTEGSSAIVYARCPIEIGVFLVHEDHKDSLDWFTCDPQNSRFALYGSPESGNLCKYSKSPIVSSYDDSFPYFNGILKIQLTNSLDGGHSLKRIVFSVSDISVYYKESKAIFDNVMAVLRKRITIEIIDVDAEKIQTDWIESPSYEKDLILKHIEMGVD